MTPSAILAVVRDVVIVGALLFIGYFLVKSGEDRVTAGQLKSLEQRITQNETIESTWRTQKDTADGKLSSDLAAISVTPATPKPAVWVYNKPTTVNSTVSSNSSAAGHSDTGPGTGVSMGGSVTQAPAEDVGPAVDEAERKIEAALAQCRDLRDSWPKKSVLVQ